MCSSDLTPVTANSGTAEVVLAPAGPTKPPVLVPSIVASPVVAPAAPIDTIAVLLASCSTECPRHGAPESTPVSIPETTPTSPTVTVDVIPVLAAAAASAGTLDDQASVSVASTPATCSLICLPPHLVAAPALVASLSPAEYGLDILQATRPCIHPRECTRGC